MTAATLAVGGTLLDMTPSPEPQASLDRRRRRPGGKARTANWSNKQRARKLREVIARDGDVCWICGGSDWAEEENHRLHRSLDHLVPRRLGGVENVENLRLAHAECNSRRAPHNQPGARHDG